MIERADRPSVASHTTSELDESDQVLGDGSEKPDRTPGEDLERLKASKDTEERVENSLERFFDNMRPTSRFGRQKASDTAQESFDNALATEERLSFTDASRSVERGRFHLKDWEREREESELKMQGVRTELESSIAEKTREISRELGQTKRWAEDTSLEEPEILNETYSFRDEDGLSSLEFVRAVSFPLQNIDRKFAQIQEALAKQGKQVEKLGREKEPAPERTVKGLGSDSEEIKKYESKAVNYVVDEELYESINDNVTKRNRLESRFIELRDTLEDFYDVQANELETYTVEMSRDLKRTVTLLEKLADDSPRDLLTELNASYNIDKRLLDDAEDHIRDQYQETIQALGETATDQYRTLEKPIQHLEQIEEELPERYFTGLSRSDKLRDVLDTSIGEDYDDYIQETVRNAVQA